MPLAERAVDLALFHRNRCFARLGSPPSRCDLDGGEMRRVLRLSHFTAGEIKLVALLVIAFGQVCGSGFEVAEEATDAFVGACGEVKLGAGSAGGIVAADR